MSSVVQTQKDVQGDEVGLGVHRRLLWGNRILCCNIIKWFGRVGTGVYTKKLTYLLVIVLRLCAKIVYQKYPRFSINAIFFQVSGV